MLSRVAAVSVHDVAEALHERLPDADVVKIHKLLYFAQGLHLGWTGEPLFEEQIDAWAKGPVVPALWHFEKSGAPRKEPRQSLAPAQMSLIDLVVSRYGKLTGRDLIQLTHSDQGPWCQVSEDDDPQASGNPRITLELMRDWFAEDPDVRAAREQVDRLRAKMPDLIPTTDSPPGAAEALESAFSRARCSGDQVDQDDASQDLRVGAVIWRDWVLGTRRLRQPPPKRAAKAAARSISGRGSRTWRTSGCGQRRAERPGSDTSARMRES